MPLPTMAMRFFSISSCSSEREVGMLKLDEKV